MHSCANPVLRKCKLENLYFARAVKVAKRALEIKLTRFVEELEPRLGRLGANLICQNGVSYTTNRIKVFANSCTLTIIISITKRTEKEFKIDFNFIPAGLQHTARVLAGE